MVVKKHRMECDAQGNLHDVGNEDEGWPMYVLTEQQFAELQPEFHQEYTRAIVIPPHEASPPTIQAGTLVLQKKRNELIVYWSEVGNIIKQKSLPLQEVNKIVISLPNPYQFFSNIDLIQQIVSLYNRPRWKIEGQAMIFIQGKMQLFYWDNHQIIQQVKSENIPNDIQKIILEQLYTQPKETNGQILPTPTRMSLLVTIIQAISQISSQPHHFSPEFLFAHEFTVHYEEFAQYFPEFGRLRELSKILSLIRFLYSQRLEQQLQINQIEAFIKNSEAETIYTEMYQQCQRMKKNITINIFNAFEKPDASISGIIQSVLPSCEYWEIQEALSNQNNSTKERLVEKEFRRQLQREKEGIQKSTHWQNTEKLFSHIGLGKETPPSQEDLEDVCFWVPASIKHEVEDVYSNGAMARHSFFVYGGVNLQPKLNVQERNKTMAGQPVKLAQAAGGGGKKPPGDGGGKPPASSNGSSGGGKGPGGGDGNGGRGDGNGKPKRFEQLILGATRDEVKTVLSNGKLPLSDKQIETIRKDILTSGRMTSINIRKMNNGIVHIACERPGHTSGFQRMSYKINEEGKKLRVVQTAFDYAEKLVHQKPGNAKNNLYDVKK